MSTPKLMRRRGPEFKSTDEEQGGHSDDTLQAWLDDAAVQLGPKASAHFGTRYPTAHALAALHLLKMSERSRADTRQNAGGTDLVGPISSVGTTGGMTFAARDMTRDASPALRAQWGQTSYGEQLIGLFIQIEEERQADTPDYITPSY